jgi:hypothetical protein
MAFASPCPVCSRGVYIDSSAPIAKACSVNTADHACTDNATWRDRTRFGGGVSRLRARLVDIPHDVLAAWPEIAALKVKALAGESLD